MTPLSAAQLEHRPTQQADLAARLRLSWLSFRGVLVALALSALLGLALPGPALARLPDEDTKLSAPPAKPAATRTISQKESASFHHEHDTPVQRPAATTPPPAAKPAAPKPRPATKPTPPKPRPAVAPAPVSPVQQDVDVRADHAREEHRRPAPVVAPAPVSPPQATPVAVAPAPVSPAQPAPVVAPAQEDVDSRAEHQRPAPEEDIRSRADHARKEHQRPLWSGSPCFRSAVAAGRRAGPLRRTRPRLSATVFVCP